MNDKTDNPVEYDNLEDILGEEEEEETTETGEEEEEDAPAGEEEEEEKPEGEDDEFRFAEDDTRVPEKFRGKTPFEVLESYSNLEAHVNQKAIEIAKSMLPGGQSPDKKSVDDTKDLEDDFGLTEEQMKAMTPKQFLAHVNKTITERAQKIVSETLQRTTDMQSTVRKDIRAATKAHPHLKTNKEYRENVLDIIEAAKARGNNMTLAEACKVADKRMGIKPGEAPADGGTPKPKKKVRTAVETTDGPTPGKNDTEEDEVRKGILGSQSTNGLGGLGI